MPAGTYSSALSIGFIPRGSMSICCVVYPRVGWHSWHLDTPHYAELVAVASLPTHGRPAPQPFTGRFRHMSPYSGAKQLRLSAHIRASFSSGVLVHVCGCFHRVYIYMTVRRRIALAG